MMINCGWNEELRRGDGRSVWQIEWLTDWLIYWLTDRLRSDILKIKSYMHIWILSLCYFILWLFFLFFSFFFLFFLFSFSLLLDFRGAIEFLLLGNKTDEAFKLAQTHSLVEVYCTLLGDFIKWNNHLYILHYYCRD